MMTKEAFISEMRTNPRFLISIITENAGEQVYQSLVANGLLSPSVNYNTIDLTNHLMAMINNGKKSAVVRSLRGISFVQGVSGTEQYRSWIGQGLGLYDPRVQGASGDGSWWINFGDGVSKILGSILGTTPPPPPVISTPSPNGSNQFVLIALIVLLGAMFFYYITK